MSSKVISTPTSASNGLKKKQTVLEAFQKYKSAIQSNENYSSRNMVTPKKLNVSADKTSSPSLKSVFSTTKNLKIEEYSQLNSQKIGYQAGSKRPNEESVNEMSFSIKKSKNEETPSKKCTESFESIQNTNASAKKLHESYLSTTDAEPLKVLNPFDKSKKLEIIGRTDERAEIKKYIDILLHDKLGGSLYISGNPGTGKSACTIDVIESNLPSIYQNNTFVVFINCMVITSAKQLYDTILSNITEQKSLKKNKNFDPKQSQIYRASPTDTCLSSQTEYATKSKLEKLFIRNNRNEGYIIVFDELDNLINLNLSLIYSFFEWAINKSSNLLLVGIANALDLTERLLPRLKARNCIPNLLNFKPYSVDDILNVLKYRSAFLAPTTHLLHQEKTNFNTLLDKNVFAQKSALIRDPALELCARKVAASTGDMRKALDVCRSVVDNTLSNNHISTNGSIENQKTKISLPEMIKALSGLNGSSTDAILRNLNFHQKIVLVTLLRIKLTSLSRKTRLSVSKYTTRQKQLSITQNLKNNQSLDINTLFRLYSDSCSELKILNTLARSEFNDLISMMESIGVLTIKSHGSNNKLNNKSFKTSTLSSTKSNVCNGENSVFLAISEKDAEKVIAELPMLSKLL
ncbi:hypothetical protein BB561_002426 [Smittium simulii]|uniref:Cell division control protein n=1 Tax=Smittium simulii TaxID=133385 RepID=A0A2T9YQL0_9FUNG|nr:hypothetical protein BB561_002426 [Smittium simulii]